MKRTIGLFLIAVITLSACNEYGKKVKISDTTEVYLKDDSSTEADAKLLGNYIDSKFKTDKKRSLQLSKEKNAYTIRMVVDEDEYKKDPSMDESFMALRFLFKNVVFTGKEVNLILTDNQFNDFKTVKDTTFTD